MTDSPEPAETEPGPLRPAVPTDGLDPTRELEPVEPDPGSDGDPPAPAADPIDPASDDRPTAPIAAVARHRRPLPRILAALRSMPIHATRAALAWSRQPVGRLALPAGLTLVLLLGSVASGAVLIPAASPSSTESAPAPPATAPVNPTAPDAPGFIPPIPTPGLISPPVTNPAEQLAGWAEKVSKATGIPVVPLQAYGYAELVLTQRTPGCQLRWTTLAAIGKVESGHGSAGGATVLSDGRVLPPIIGPRLDGQGDRLEIRDTDQGDLDNDREYDRAVGPMQFIPSTWRQQATDANGDGIADVHNIYDAALAAGNYLCQGGRDLSKAADWWEAILSYNNVVAYADAVFAAADEYGQQSVTA